MSRGSVIPGLAVAEAAEVDAGEDDLAVALLDPALDLREDRGDPAATRCAAHERDDAERARERAAVLDLHECARPLEPRIGLDAGDSADVSRDGVRYVLARPRDDSDVRRYPFECGPQVRRAPRDVDAAVRPRGARHGLPRLRDRLVRDAARVHDGDVADACRLDVPVGEQALAHGLSVRVRHLAAEEADGEGRHRGN